MSYFVYILQCGDGTHYYGSTGDLGRRLSEHREGGAGWTARRQPVRLVYFEECETLAQARRRERMLKNGRTRRKTLDRMIATFPPAKLASFV
jgi:putative endonuclease